MSAQPIHAADTADEARAINQQVLTLITATKFAEAGALASKGLALCEDAGWVKVFCVGQFNELLGELAYRQAQYPDALAYFEQALKVRKEGLGHEHLLVARSQLQVGRALIALHRGGDAEAALKDAIAIFEKLAPADRELGVALLELENVYLASGRIDEEVSGARHTVVVYTAIEGPDGQNVRAAKRMLGVGLLILGKRQYTQQDNNEAEPSLREGLQLLDPPSSGTEKQFIDGLAYLGNIYENEGRYPEAETRYLQALAYTKKYLSSTDPALPDALVNLATHYDKAGRPNDSIDYALSTISIFDQSKNESLALGIALKTLGRDDLKLGRYVDAEILLGRAKDVLDRVSTEDDLNRVSVRLDLGEVLSREEKFQEAESEYQAAFAMTEKFAYRDTAWRSTALDGLSLVFRDTARYREAERMISTAIAIEEAAGDPRKGNLADRLVVLASILRRENRFADAEKIATRALALETTDLDRATALNLLGLIYSTTGQYDKADPLLTEALAIRTKALSADDPFRLETVANIADLDSSVARYGEAETMLRDALRLTEARGPPKSTSIALHALLLANVLIPIGKLLEAETLTHRAIELYQARLGPDHPRTGGALKTLASIETLRGKDGDAEAHYRRALAIDEHILGADNPAVSGDLVALAPILVRTGRRQEAKADIDRALAIVTAQFGDDSVISAGAMMASARTAYDEARYADARSLADHARQVQEHTLGSDNPLLAGSWIFASRLDIATGRLDAAATDVDHAAGIVTTTLPPGHPFNIDILEGQADVALAQGNLTEAEQDDRQALALAEKLFALDHPVRLGADDRLINMLWANGKFAEAERLRRDELVKTEQSPGDSHRSVARATENLAGVLANSARIDDAIALYKRALAINKQISGPDSREAALDYLAIGSALGVLGRFNDASAEFNRVRTIGEKQNDPLLVSAALNRLAELAASRGAPAEALVHMERNLDVVQQMFGTNSPVLVATLAQLGKFYVLTDRREDVRQIVGRIEALVGEDPSEQSPGYLNFLQLRAILDFERGDVKGAEAIFKRAIAFSTKYGGPLSGAIGVDEGNLALTYLKAQRFSEAIASFNSALTIFKRQSGANALIVGYALVGAANAYAGLGEQAKAEALRSAAIQILGPMLASRPAPKWL